MEETMNKIMIFIMIGILLAGCSTTSSAPISQVYAFGDDYSDNGNAYKMVNSLTVDNEAVIPWVKWLDTYYWQGRFSNGPLPVEVLAKKLKIDLVDYAVAGALSDTHNIAETILLIQRNTGLLSQVQKFITDLDEEKADADAIYVIQIGDGDFENSKPDDEFDSGILSDKVIANIGEAISQLTDAGAKRFVVVNMHDISKQPLMEEVFVTAAKAYQSYFNATLLAEMETLAEDLDVEIKIFDYAAVSDGIRSEPDKYGLINLDDKCLAHTEPAPTWADAITTVCKSPDEYYYWDDEHPTRVVNQIIGEAMAEQLSK
jgi:cholinesterase